MEYPAQPAGDPAEAFVTRCRCGHAIRDRAVRAVKRYGLWGAMGLMMGYTARPKRIDFVCGQCGDVFDSITNRAALEKYRYSEPRADEL